MISINTHIDILPDHEEFLKSIRIPKLQELCHALMMECVRTNTPINCMTILDAAMEKAYQEGLIDDNTLSRCWNFVD